MSECHFTSCQRAAKKKGLCPGHYAQVRRGNPLTPLRAYGVDSPHQVRGAVAQIQVGAKEALVDLGDLPKVINYTWGLTADGYARAYVRGSDPPEWVFMHHLVGPVLEGHETDHFNGNRLEVNTHYLEQA